MVESLKIITRQASLRVAEYAFHYAKTHGRERVSAIHKANIMQKTDGLFLKVCTGRCHIVEILTCLTVKHHANSVFFTFSVVVRLQRSTLRLHTRKLSLTIAV